MILSFRDRRTAAVFMGKVPKGFPSDLAVVTRRKLVMLDNARSLDDLRVPPSNYLKALAGDRAGQYSVRVNDQFRLCFRWSDGHASNVEFTDYH